MMLTMGIELRRFLIVGSTTVAIDFLCYSILLAIGIAVPIAKAGGFFAGMVFAWFANRLYTFSSEGGGKRLTAFIVLYIGTLGLNVVINQLCLVAFGSSSLSFIGAFLIATGISAATNFIGMKYLVFRSKA
jgi:putative flippase GtrA